ncbi:MAG: DUF357 domain-containing protein [Nanoarchaeota archaeon]|nr:DUF357 domain-containing protein [Nanoarchaeota archaeon]
MNLKQAAEKEMKRMEEVFNDLKIINKRKADEFYSFSENYFEDGKYFFKKGKYLEAFEAFIISWAYIDIGIKLGLFDVSKNVRKYFTS